MNEKYEKYETPEVEFVEMDDTDVVVCSGGGCSGYMYGDGCTGFLAP